MRHSDSETSTESFDGSIAPVQAFTSGVVAVDIATAHARLGRPIRVGLGDAEESKMESHPSWE